MNLTDKEKDIILNIRKIQTEKLARAQYKFHLLKTAYEFETWLEENGAGETYSTFCDDFGYEGREGEDRPQLYKDVVKICCEARWIIDGADA